MDWEVHPDGLEQLLTRLAGDYQVPRVLVTENGSAWPDEVVDGTVADLARADFLEAHVAAAARAVGQGVSEADPRARGPDHARRIAGGGPGRPRVVGPSPDHRGTYRRLIVSV
jgi:hypothetical protein